MSDLLLHYDPSRPISHLGHVCFLSPEPGLNMEKLLSAFMSQIPGTNSEKNPKRVNAKNAPTLLIHVYQVFLSFLFVFFNSRTSKEGIKCQNISIRDSMQARKSHFYFI